MPQPAGTNGGSSTEFAQLRELLIGSELEELASVRERLDDPGRRASDLAQVLPEALKAARPKSLRDALEPVFEKVFHSSVRKNPKELADAIYPIIGPAIRNSIAAAIRDFAETLNQIVEKSASFRSVRWRFEAIMTGKPFSEILLSKSLLYRVEQVFLIHRKSGLLLQHAAARGSVLKDADMISGMLTAIQDFLSDSFTEGGQNLETVDVGRFKLWLTYGQNVMLAAAVSGTAPLDLKRIFRNALDRIEEALGTEIGSFKQDDLTVFEPARPFLEACLLGQSAPEKRKRLGLWPLVVVLAAIAAGFFVWQAREQSRWNQYFASLKRQPGFVITGIERRGSSYVVAGLKDPQAPDPAVLLRAAGLDQRKVRHELQPYLSLNTEFAVKRELDAARELIEKSLIRFDPGSAKVAVSEADRIDSVTAVMRRFLRGRPGSRIAVVGHADETGAPETNDQLSRDRASHVVDALVGQDIPAGVLEMVSAGNTQPLRAGSTDWDRAANRSVSFRVTTQNP